MNNKSNIILVFDHSGNADFDIGYAFEVKRYRSLHDTILVITFDTCKNYDPSTIEKWFMW